MQAAQQAHAEQMQSRLDMYRDAFLFVDTATPGWRILHLNQAAVDRLGGYSDQGLLLARFVMFCGACCLVASVRSVLA